MEEGEGIEEGEGVEEGEGAVIEGEGAEEEGEGAVEGEGEGEGNNDGCMCNKESYQKFEIEKILDDIFMFLLMTVVLAAWRRKS